MSVRLLLGAGLVYARRLPLAPSPILSCCAPHLHTGAMSSLTEGARASHTSSKEAGYYRLQNPKHINIDPCVYEIRTMRGSGPGGQGTNSSSNKVELRADMELLSEFFDDELLAALRRHEAGGALTNDGTTIVVSCHEHRSALQNKEGCLRKLQTLLHKASWVPPAEAGLVERPSFIVTEQKEMLPRLALSHAAAAAAPLAVTISTASATCVSQRWCSSVTSDKPGAAGANPFTSAIAKTLREKVFSQDFAAVKAAAPKETELLKKWRAVDGTPEQSPRQPATPGTADSSDVEPQIAEGARNVAVSHGKTFRDSRPVDPKESVECKRRRLIYQSRYRGMVEMDLIFGHFARCKLETLDASMLDEYDMLLKQLDSELFRWLVMGVDAPEEVAKLPCFDELRRFIKEERTELLGSN